MTIRFRSVLAASALASLSGAALAHPGHAPASFASGFAHPLGGLDHLLAMLAVGLYAARQAGAARLLLWHLCPRTSAEYPEKKQIANQSFYCRNIYKTVC